MARPAILILHAPGTNRDREAAWACELAGGAPEIVHVSQLLDGARDLSAFDMLVLPGGFSFGDDLGAGKVWATLLRHGLGEQLRAFDEAGKPILGICNGFQALVKAGLLVDGLGAPEQRVTLARNDSSRFECRWVWLEPDPKSPCVFTRELTEPIQCPVAHGEGRLVVRDDATRRAIEQGHLGALRYVDPSGAEAAWPFDPNGSIGHLAGLTNPRGNILGLMPHPEDHLFPHQHPRFHRGEGGGLGTRLFEAGVRYAASRAWEAA